MSKRILWIDVLRIIGMVGVMLIHVADNTLNTFGLAGTAGLLFTIICKLSYFAIPLFVMISGMLLLDKDIDYKKIFFKYIRRMLIVLILFGGFFAFLEEFFVTRTINSKLFINIIKRIIAGDLWAHMWYIYLIIALYLITPILNKWIKNTSEKEQLIFMWLLYILTILFNELGFNTAFYVPISTGFVFIYLLGNYLSNKTLSKKIEIVLYILGITSFIAVALLTYFHTGSNFIGYTQTLCITIAASLFYLLKNKIITNNNLLSKIICSLGECSFGIYIIHQLFINIIYKVLKIKYILNNPYIGIIIYTLVILLISYIVVYILRKIKLVRKYIL